MSHKTKWRSIFQTTRALGYDGIFFIIGKTEHMTNAAIEALILAGEAFFTARKDHLIASKHAFQNYCAHTGTPRISTENLNYSFDKLPEFDEEEVVRSLFYEVSSDAKTTWKVFQDATEKLVHTMKYYNLEISLSNTHRSLVPESLENLSFTSESDAP